MKSLQRNRFGQLVLVDGQGSTHIGVTPVRAYPLSAPDAGLSLLAPNGAEVAWIPHLSALDSAFRTLIEAELREREFTPEITRLIGVSSFATPCQWTVQSDRGEHSFTLRGEEDIRRLEGASLLITDNHGLHYTIRDRFALDRDSRRLLDRFL